MTKHLMISTGLLILTSASFAQTDCSLKAPVTLNKKQTNVLSRKFDIVPANETSLYKLEVTYKCIGGSSGTDIIDIAPVCNAWAVVKDQNGVELDVCHGFSAGIGGGLNVAITKSLRKLKSCK